MKIYTKTGDKGTTSLYGGERVSKDDIRIEAYGTVDELNSHLGLLMSKITSESDHSFLKEIQNILFDIGSHLATMPGKNLSLPEIKEIYITNLEKEMDNIESKIEPLKTFILPSGSETIALSHICRTICRRAERRVIAIDQAFTHYAQHIKYLNRLSDYFFMLSRKCSKDENVDELPWLPNR